VNLLTRNTVGCDDQPGFKRVEPWRLAYEVARSVLLSIRDIDAIYAVVCNAGLPNYGLARLR